MIGFDFIYLFTVSGVFVVCRIYTDFGSPNQKEYVNVVRLTKTREEVEIGNVFWYN